MGSRKQKQKLAGEGFESLQLAVREFKTLLLRYGEDHWANNFDDDLRSLRDVQKILGLHWPGMGGLSDLVISRANGHRISPNRESQVNQRLHRLMDIILDECYRLTGQQGNSLRLLDVQKYHRPNKIDNDDDHPLRDR